MASEKMLIWASDAPENAVVAPSVEKQAAGWEVGEIPPVEYFNWFWKTMTERMAQVENVAESDALQATNIIRLADRLTKLELRFLEHGLGIPPKKPVEPCHCGDEIGDMQSPDADFTEKFDEAYLADRFDEAFNGIKG